MSSSRSPGYRYWLLCRSKYGEDDLVDAILNGHVEPAVIQECRDIYEDKLMRLYVEACLLATEDFEDISNSLEVDAHVLMVYHDLYYAVHDLSRIRKTRHLSKIDNNDEKNLKQWSLTNGMDFIKWRLGIITKQSTLDNIIQLQSDAYFKSKEAFFNSNNTTASVEGLKWSRQAVVLTRLIADLESGDSEEASDDLSLELERLNESNINLKGIEDLT